MSVPYLGSRVHTNKATKKGQAYHKDKLANSRGRERGLPIPDCYDPLLSCAKELDLSHTVGVILS